MKNGSGNALRIVIYAITLLVGIFVILYAHFSYNRVDRSKDKSILYEQGWTYFNGEEFVSAGRLPVNVDWGTDTELVLKNILPDIDREHNTLLFRSSNQMVKVYVENKLIYSFGIGDERPFGNTPGSIWNYVIIPEDCSGKQIEIRLQSHYSDCAGFISTFRLGSYSNMLNEFVSDKIPEIIISLGVLIYGVVLIAFNIMLRKYTKHAAGYLYLGGFSILISIWSLLETQTVQFVYSGTAVLTLVTFYALMLIPVSFNSFIREMYFEDNSKMFKILNLAAYINIIIQTVLQLLNVADVYEMVWVTHCIIAAVGIFNVVKVAMEHIRTKEVMYGRIAFGFAILVICSVVDGVRFYFGSVGDYAKVFRIGIVIFIVLASVWYTSKAVDLLRKGIQVEVLKRMAYEDALTKCKNRAYFEKELGELEAYHKKYKKVAIATFDINDLKYNNDTYGHGVGDKLICKCVYCISSAFKELGEVSRIGGDEFAVIMKNISADMIEGAIDIMKEKADYYSQKGECNLNIAYGYAFYDENVDKNMEALVSRADKLMYEMKKQMKNEK